MSRARGYMGDGVIKAGVHRPCSLGGPMGGNAGRGRCAGGSGGPGFTGSWRMIAEDIKGGRRNVSVKKKERRKKKKIRFVVFKRANGGPIHEPERTYTGNNGGGSMKKKKENLLVGAKTTGVRDKKITNKQFGGKKRKKGSKGHRKKWPEKKKITEPQGNVFLWQTYILVKGHVGGAGVTRGKWKTPHLEQLKMRLKEWGVGGKTDPGGGGKTPGKTPMEQK